MSKTVGIVAEYNPFHTGHRYQIDYLKRLGFDTVAIAMSGSVVQRGELAFMSKFTRREMAIDNGASLVAEIPYPYSARSAESYATAGMQTLKALGVDAISFGSECADTALLSQIADYLLSQEYEASLKKHLEEKLPFAKARERALFDKFDISQDVISARNDILAIEYLKACKRMGWRPEIIPVKREGAAYKDVSDKKVYASASGIRNMAREYRYDTMYQFVPDDSRKVFETAFDRGSYFLADDVSFEKAVLFVLRQKTADDFIKVYDCNTELANAFEKAVVKADSIKSLFDNLPTKQYTRARLNRIMLAAFLDCRDDMPYDIQYVRILGIATDKEDYLKEVGKKCPLPVSHSAKILSEKNDICKKIVLAESRACDAQSAFFKISDEARTDYTAKFIKI